MDKFISGWKRISPNTRDEFLSHTWRNENSEDDRQDINTRITIVTIRQFEIRFQIFNAINILVLLERAASIAFVENVQ